MDGSAKVPPSQLPDLSATYAPAAGSPSYAPRLARSAAKTTNYTAAANEHVLCNAVTGPITVTLPTNPADKTLVSVEKIDSANVVLIQTGSGDVLYQVGSRASTMGLMIANQAQNLQFDSATRVWRPLNNYLPVEGLDARYAPLSAGPKKSARVCATSNVTISVPGGAIDTITLNNGDRVLLVGQTNANENGVYVYATASTPMNRATDVSQPTDISGAIVYVNEGWLQGGHGWRNTNYPTMTVGITSQTWVEFYCAPIPGQISKPVAYKPGNYYWCSSTGATAPVTATADRPTASPFSVSSPLIITAMIAEVRTIGDAACVFRIGVWKDNGYGQPGGLVYDGGNVPAGATTGVKVIAVPGGLTVTLPPGLYWAGGVAQGVTSVAPIMGGVAPGSVIMPFPLGTASPGAMQAVGGFNGAAQSGPLRDFAVNAVSGSVVRVGFLVPA
ncbi:hypothetical protein ACQCSV_16215 [Pseudarthrobacter sp. S3]|uniref:hypothetical protein n=1 Tax=Pseudarthrobacter sp. S3 TaxID=3418419 RepID=UPI003CF2CDCD